ncbi:MAG: SMI1/KNR4 family protein, partial [Lachnospiraceae bacterium]|nr:SMI1/KNR4 family protein [Lachnospiraceae bacterium]
MSERFPLEELRDLLNKAKEMDANCKQFGANAHKYQWNPPASLEEVEDFEQKIGVRLPKEYRSFLLLAGNGGAGPYYGLFSLQEVLYWLEDDMDLKKEPVLYPGIEIPQEDYEEEELDAEEYDCEHMIEDAEQENEPESEEESWLQGCIPIGSQGDSYFMYLLLSGPNEGRVVYVESELTYVFFPREQGFLAWYKRWLREISGGYRIFWFGTNLDGDENELRACYKNTADKDEKRLILSSMKKFPSLSAASKAWIAEAAQEYIQEPDARWLLDLLQTAGAKEPDAFLEQRWELGLYDGIILEIYYVLHHCRKEDEEETSAFLEHWGKRIMKVLPQISQGHWYIAFETFKKCSWLKLRDAAGLLEIADKKVRPELLRTFGAFPDAAQNLNLFLKELEERENLEF